MKDENRKEKLLSIMKKAYRSFNPENAPLKVKIICALIALVLSGLIILIKISLR